MKYKSRYTKSSTPKFNNQGLMTAVTRLAEKDRDRIQGLERLAQQHKSATKDFADEKKGADSRELSHNRSLQNFETDIFNNQKAALKIRADREVEALLAEAKEYERKSKLFAGIAEDFGGALAKRAGDIYQAISEHEARKYYAENEPTFSEANKLGEEAQTSILEIIGRDAQENKEGHDPEDLAITLADVTKKASGARATVFVNGYINNKDVIEQSIKGTQINGDSVYTEQTVRLLYREHARSYLQQYGISETSKAGFRLLQEVNSWAAVEAKRFKDDRLFNGTEANLDVDTELLDADLKQYSSVAQLPKEVLDRELSAHFNVAVARVVNGWVKDDEGNIIPGGTLTPVEAAEYVVQKFVKNNPHLRKEELLKMLDTARVASIKRFKFTEERFLREYRGSDFYKKLKKEGGNPEAKGLLAVARKAAKDKWDSELPTWGSVLEERGSLELITKAFDSAKDNLKGKEKKDSDRNAAADKETMILRFDDPKREDHLDLKDFSTGGGREQALAIARDKSTNKLVSDYIYDRLDFDPQRMEGWFAEEAFKAAVLDTGSKDDDMYYFNYMSEAAKKHHWPKHESLGRWHRSKPNLEAEVLTPIRGAIKEAYLGSYKTDSNEAELEQLEKAGKQLYFHYLHRLSNPDNEDYEKDVEEAKRLALNFVKEDISKGNGLFQKEQFGKIGDTDLRIKWTHFNYAARDNVSDLKDANKFFDKFKKYDPTQVKNIITPKERTQLMEAAMTGRAERWTLMYDAPIPDNIIQLKLRFPHLTLKTIIDDIFIETKSDHDMEVEWPVGLDDLLVSYTPSAYKYTRSKEEDVLTALNIKRDTGFPPIRKDLIEFIGDRNPWQ